jgi:hypothetical protein
MSAQTPTAGDRIQELRVLSRWLSLPPAELAEALRRLTALGRGQRPAVGRAVTVAVETVSSLWLDRR